MSVTCWALVVWLKSYQRLGGGRLVAARPRGRPAVYCSRACQARANRARKAQGRGDERP